MRRRFGGLSRRRGRGVGSACGGRAGWCEVVRSRVWWWMRVGKWSCWGCRARRREMSGLLLLMILLDMASLGNHWYDGVCLGETCCLLYFARHIECLRTMVRKGIVSVENWSSVFDLNGHTIPPDSSSLPRRRHPATSVVAERATIRVS